MFLLFKIMSLIHINLKDLIIYSTHKYLVENIISLYFLLFISLSSHFLSRFFWKENKTKKNDKHI